MGQVTDEEGGRGQRLGFRGSFSEELSFADALSLTPEFKASGIVKARAAPRKSPDRPNPPDGEPFDPRAKWQAESRRSDRNGRRLCRAAPARGKRFTGYDRFHAGRDPLSARLASARVGGPSLPGAWLERHCSDGGRAGRGLLIAGFAARLAASVGRPLRAQPDQPSRHARRPRCGGGYGRIA